MIVGRDNLLKMFPEFENDIAENGIDLRVGHIYEIVESPNQIGCIDNVKMLPDNELVQLTKEGDCCSYYELKPDTFYSVEIDRPIHIPDGYCQLYKIRSTFARCGLLLLSAVGDNDFNGTLRFGLKNLTNQPIFIGENERIVQAVTFANDGTASSYDGSYQNDKIFDRG